MQRSWAAAQKNWFTERLIGQYLPRFVMTNSGGEKEREGKQNSALRLQTTKNKTYELSKNRPSTAVYY